MSLTGRSGRILLPGERWDKQVIDRDTLRAISGPHEPQSKAATGVLAPESDEAPNAMPI
jgi:hypothetical protein